MLRASARILRAALAAALLFAGFILGRFADDAMPAYYVLRPLVVALPLALVIGLMSWLCFRTAAPVAAAIGAAIVVFWSSVASWIPLWGLHILLASAVVTLVALLLKIRGRTTLRIPRVPSQLVLGLVTVFFAIGVVRSVGAASASATPEPVSAATATDGPNLYLLLVDGYPRSDTLLTEFGIDIQPFASDLSARGFTVYERAESDRILTELTLLSLLEGTVAGVPTQSLGSDGRRAVRQQMASAELPRRVQRAGYEWIVIDSPVGHVTFDGGRHIQHGGLNTFEERLLAESLLAPAIAEWFPSLPMDSIRDHLEASFDSIVELAARDERQLVLAHLLAPHTPFLWGAAHNPVPAPSFWPRVQLFESQSHITGVSLEEFAEGMRSQLAVLNARLIDTVDAILSRDPGAVIVLFGDHGARRDLADQQTEWHRAFLAARTPAYPQLFADNPSPTVVLRTLLDAYVIGVP
jgi:hypothetical protein